MASIMPFIYPKKEPIVNPGFVYSSRYPSGSTSDNPAKYPSPMLTTNPDSVLIGNPNKKTSNYSKEFTITKPINTLI